MRIDGILRGSRSSLATLLTLLTIAACGVEDPEPAEPPVAGQQAAVDTPPPAPVEPTCDGKLSEIVPYTTTSCMGPVATCQQVTLGWTQRVPVETLSESEHYNNSSAWPKAGADQVCGLLATDLNRTQEGGRVKWVQRVVEQRTYKDTTNLWNCTVRFTKTTFDKTSTCTHWTDQIYQAPRGWVDVGQRTCTTCEDRNPEPSQYERAECMNQVLIANPPFLAPNRDKLIGEIKYLYEKTGELRPALNYLRLSPTVVPPCGPAPVLAQCNDEVDWRINLCARLTTDFARKARNSKSAGSLDNGINAHDADFGLLECNRAFDKLAALGPDSCPASQQALLAIQKRIQAAIDRDYAQPGWVGGETPPTNVQMVTRRFRQFHELEQDVTPILSPDLLQDFLQPILASTMDWIHTQLVPALAPPQAGNMAQFLNAMHVRDFNAAKDLLNAIYPTPANASPVLGPWGQVNVVPEAIDPLADRLENFLVVHDFRCALGVCPDIEEQLDQEIANIALSSSITPLWQSGSLSIPAAERSLINDWANLLYTKFGSTSTFGNALPTAIARFLPPGITQLSELPAGRVPAPLARIFGLVGRAIVRDRLHHTTGRFTSPEGKKISRLTNLANREKMSRDIEAMANDAVTHANTFNNEFVSTVTGILTGTSNDAQLAGLRAQYTATSTNLASLQAQKAGHQRALTKDTTMDERVHAMSTEVAADFHGELATQFVAKADKVQQTINASSATFESRDREISTYQVFASPTLSKDQLYQVNITGTWSPTCALRRFKENLFAARGGGSWWDNVVSMGSQFLKDAVMGHGFGVLGELLKADKVEINVDNAEAGPEGFTVVQSNGRFTVEQASLSATPGLYGISAGRSEEHGSSSKIEAAFNSGLRLPEGLVVLPSNDAPVGALIAVEMPPHATKIEDAKNIYVIKAPTTTLPVKVDGSHFVLVANDNCTVVPGAVRNNSVSLTANTFVLTGGDKLMRAFIAAVGTVVENFRTVKTPIYVGQGELLVTDTATLEQEAFLLFKQAVNQHAPEMADTPFDQLPTAFQRLYSLFVQREINRIDRIVRIGQLDREIAIANITLNGFAEQVASLGDVANMSARLKEWNLARLDTFSSLADVDKAREYLRDYLLPVFQLWYPDVVSHLTAADSVKALATLSPFTSALDYSQKMSNALRTVASAYRTESELRYNNLTNPMIVVVSIPDPDATCPSGPPTTPGGCSPPPLADGRVVSVEQARAFWTALRAGVSGDRVNGTYELRIDPSLLYTNVVEPFRLVCQASLPVVTRIAFMPILPSVQNGSQGTYIWPISFGPTQTYVAAEGAQEFSLLDHLGKPDDRSLVTNLIFASKDTVVSRFQSATHAATASGISPFTTYELDFSTFGSQLAADLQGVKQFALVIEVEAVSGARAAVPVCNAGH